MNKIITIRLDEELLKDQNKTNEFIASEIAKHGAFKPKSLTAIEGHLATILYVLLEAIEIFPNFPGTAPQQPYPGVWPWTQPYTPSPYPDPYPIPYVNRGPGDWPPAPPVWPVWPVWSGTGTRPIPQPGSTSGTVVNPQYKANTLTQVNSSVAPQDGTTATTDAKPPTTNTGATDKIVSLFAKGVTPNDAWVSRVADFKNIDYVLGAADGK